MSNTASVLRCEKCRNVIQIGILVDDPTDNHTVMSCGKHAIHTACFKLGVTKRCFVCACGTCRMDIESDGQRVVGECGCHFHPDCARNQKECGRCNVPLVVKEQIGQSEPSFFTNLLSRVGITHVSRFTVAEQRLRKWTFKDMVAAGMTAQDLYHSDFTLSKLCRYRDNADTPYPIGARLTDFVALGVTGDMFLHRFFHIPSINTCKYGHGDGEDRFVTGNDLCTAFALYHLEDFYKANVGLLDRAPSHYNGDEIGCQALAPSHLSQLGFEWQDLLQLGLTFEDILRFRQPHSTWQVLFWERRDGLNQQFVPTEADRASQRFPVPDHYLTKELLECDDVDAAIACLPVLEKNYLPRIQLLARMGWMEGGRTDEVLCKYMGFERVDDGNDEDGETFVRTTDPPPLLPPTVTYDKTRPQQTTEQNTPSHNSAGEDERLRQLLEVQEHAREKHIQQLRSVMQVEAQAQQHVPSEHNLQLQRQLQRQIYLQQQAQSAQKQALKNALHEKQTPPTNYVLANQPVLHQQRQQAVPRVHRALRGY